MKKMSAKKLKEVLKKHELWLKNEPGGELADLSFANLSFADLSFANLSFADLRSADLSSADLRSANLRSADLSFANLSFADLSFADLRSADLRSADLRSANLRSANLRFADLRSADLDFSSFPLWCGGLNVHLDDRQLIQMAYHLAKNGLFSKNASEETKAELSKIVDFANKFHRTEECGRIET